MKGLAEFRTRQAHLGDVSYVMGLMRANRESVGGLPRPAIEERVRARTLLLGFINDEPCGYLLYDFRAGVLRIPQACIQYDARRRKYGEALFGALLRLCDAEEIYLRCAADLEANLFWREIGFTCLGATAGGRRRGRTINLWAMWLQPHLFPLTTIGVAPVAEIRQDCMYDDTDYFAEAPSDFVDGHILPKIAWANRNSKPSDDSLQPSLTGSTG